MYAWLIIFALAGGAEAPAFNRCRPQFDVATRHNASAARDVAARRFRAANRKLDQGIRTLGYVAANSSTADDTDWTLLFADSQLRSGRLEAAVSAKQGVLETRLRRCTRPL